VGVVDGSGPGTAVSGWVAGGVGYLTGPDCVTAVLRGEGPGRSRERRGAANRRDRPGGSRASRAAL